MILGKGEPNETMLTSSSDGGDMFLAKFQP
jgi:hypothetical protein